jgi:DNA polymerase Ligase (LigD)
LDHIESSRPQFRQKQKLSKPFLELESNTALSSQSDQASAFEKYRQKLDFSKTPEPPPLIPRSSRQGSRHLFVIQKHAASRLHYDFRLEIGGTLKSWAVPNGPPYELNERRLAMATEDHPWNMLNLRESSRKENMVWYDNKD